MDEMDIWKEIAEKSDRKFITMSEAGKEVMDTDNYHGRPVLGKIVVLPRSAVTDISPDKKWALISISDPGMPRPILADSSNLIDAIYLKFDDVEFERASMIPINENQAKDIVAFAKKNWEEAELIVVHCNAGISRSSAVGKAISEIYQPDQVHYFDKFFMPNVIVYNALMKISGIASK